MNNQVKIDDCFDFVRNGLSIKQENGKKGIPITRIETIWNSNIDINRFGYADIFDIDKYSSNLLSVGDLLMTHINSPKHLGKCAIYEGIPEKLIHGMNLLCLRPSESLFPKYAFYFFNSNNFKSKIPKISNQSVNQASFSAGKLKELKIPLPPLQTQKKIAQILDQADALRKKTQQIIDEYDKLAQSIFLDMFGDPVTNPKRWEKRLLGDITNLVTDGKHGDCNDEENSGYYFISAKDVNNSTINYSNARQIVKKEFEEVDRRTNLQPGDLVMVNTGATIGKMAIAKNIPETRKTTFQKSVAVIKCKEELIRSIFLKYVFLLRINTFANRGSGSAIKNLLLSEMRRFKIIVAPIELQNQFAEKIKLIEQQKELAKQSLKESEDLFNALLQKAFKGELVK